LLVGIAGENASRERQWTRWEAFDEIKVLVPSLVRLIAGGGEPLLLAHWRNFLREFDPAAAPLLNFAMTTNATIVRPEIIEGLKRFKSLHIIVSLDGANAEVYEHIRVNASFSEVESNIHTLKALVNSRPHTDVTTFGLCMSVMKSNITHLPEFLRWAAYNGLLFSLHPVISLPVRESLVSFSDPVREMAHWREALNEAWRVVRTIDTPMLPDMWRYMQRIDEGDARSGWPHLEAIEDFIPWDIAYERHYRANLLIPPHAWAAAHSRWPDVAPVVVFRPQHAMKWRAWTYPYYSTVENGSFETYLPLGSYECWLINEFESSRIEIGEIEVTPHRVSYIEQSAHFAKVVDAILRN
jgi:hypothetical protein